MTEFGEKWAEETMKGSRLFNLTSVGCEFWLRAFCNEVEKRAKRVISCDQDECIATAFDKFRCEVLGEG